MNFDDTVEEAQFRENAREWIDANAPRHLMGMLAASSFGKLAAPMDEIVHHSREWQRRKFDAGWACIHWPKAFGGRDATPIERVIWQQEEGIYSLLSGIFALGQGMCAPTLMENGTERQCLDHVPAIASGERIWCQLFSEPAGGSDLAGVRTRAVRDGPEWVVEGQKIWTTGAQYSDFGLLLTRTNTSVPKHAAMMFLSISSVPPSMRIPGARRR